MNAESGLKHPKFYFVKNPTITDRPSYLLFLGTQLHVELNVFSRSIERAYASNTVRSYLTSLIRHLNWLIANGMHWDGNPDDVRPQIISFLSAEFRCLLRPFQGQRQLIRMTTSDASSVKVFLTAYRAFYDVLIVEKIYPYENPLVDWKSAIKNSDDSVAAVTEFPKMPAISGVEAEKKSRSRLTDSYFLIVNNEWVPQVIDDIDFPIRIFAAGKKARWSYRETLITRLLFETGARVSEICALTLGDWQARGLKNEATSINKGDGEVRSKFLRWSDAATRALFHYFDHVRTEYDAQRQSVRGALNLHKNDPSALFDIPIFLSKRGTALRPGTFRDLYWKPACDAGGIDADIHQTRHWYVTTAIREIHATTQPGIETERRIADLIQYMNWKSGMKTLEAYEHHFNNLRHAEVQNSLLAKLDSRLSEPHTSLVLTRNKRDLATSTTELEFDVELDYLLKLGGHSRG